MRPPAEWGNDGPCQPGVGDPRSSSARRSVAFSGHRGPVLALDRISLDVAAGEFLCLVGPKVTPAKPDVLKKAGPHALDANLEMDASVLDSMQKLNAELGYLKYKEMQPVGKLFNFAYRDRAVQELGRK